MNIVTVNLSSKTGIIQTEKMTQWDSGYSLHISGLTEEAAETEVHFANHGSNEALCMSGTWEEDILIVSVPDKLLTNGTDIFVFVYEKTEESGRTIRTAKIPVEKRAKPDDYVYTKEEVKRWTVLEEDVAKIYAKLDAQTDWNQSDETAPDYVKNRTHYVEIIDGEEVVHELDEKYIPDTIARKTEITTEVESALQTAKESGEFDGADGQDYVLTEQDKQDIADLISASIVNGNEVAY